MTWTAGYVCLCIYIDLEQSLDCSFQIQSRDCCYIDLSNRDNCNALWFGYNVIIIDRRQLSSSVMILSIFVWKAQRRCMCKSRSIFFSTTLSVTYFIYIHCVVQRCPNEERHSKRTQFTCLKNVIYFRRPQTET
jgi:hypothetical protein